MNKTTIATAVIACFALTASAHAQVVYDNLNAASLGTEGLIPVDGGPLADSFSSGAGGSLTDVELAIFDGGGDDGAGTTTISLFSDDGGSPLSSLGTLATLPDSSLSSSPTAVLDIPVSGFTLTPSTTYWIEASASNSSASWNYSGDVSGVGVVGQFNFYNGGSFPNGPSDTDAPFQMAVALNGADIPSAATPEPGSLALLATAGVSALGLLRRRRA